MSKLIRRMAAAAAAHRVARLLPAERRDWAEWVWAEAHAVPPGLTRLAWRAGGIWMLARETARPRRRERIRLPPDLAILPGHRADHERHRRLGLRRLRAA